VIVGVPHGPTGGMPSRFLAIRPVHSPHVSVRPFAPGIVFHYLKRNRIIEIAFAGASDFIESPPRFDLSLSRECTLPVPSSATHGRNRNIPEERTYPRNIRIVYVPLLMRMLLLLVAGDSR